MSGRDFYYLSQMLQGCCVALRIEGRSYSIGICSGNGADFLPIQETLSTLHISLKFREGGNLTMPSSVVAPDPCPRHPSAPPQTDHSPHWSHRWDLSLLPHQSNHPLPHHQWDLHAPFPPRTPHPPCKQMSYSTRQGQLCVRVARSKAWEWQER